MYHTKDNYNSLSLITTDAKILNKIMTNYIHIHFKDYTAWLSVIYQGVFNSHKSVWHTTSTTWKMNTVWASQYMQKKAWQNPTLISDKKAPGSGHIWILTHHNKRRIWQSQGEHHSQWWNTESLSTKIRKKTRLSIFTTAVQHRFWMSYNSNQRRKRNTRNPNWKRSKTSMVSRWQTIPRKS